MILCAPRSQVLYAIMNMFLLIIDASMLTIQLCEKYCSHIIWWNEYGIYSNCRMRIYLKYDYQGD